jgi:hypothetical protein
MSFSSQCCAVPCASPACGPAVAFTCLLWTQVQTACTQHQQQLCVAYQDYHQLAFGAVSATAGVGSGRAYRTCLRRTEVFHTHVCHRGSGVRTSGLGCPPFPRPQIRRFSAGGGSPGRVFGCFWLTDCGGVSRALRVSKDVGVPVTVGPPAQLHWHSVYIIVGATLAGGRHIRSFPPAWGRYGGASACTCVASRLNEHKKRTAAVGQKKSWSKETQAMQHSTEELPVQGE